MREYYVIWFEIFPILILNISIRLVSIFILLIYTHG